MNDRNQVRLSQQSRETLERWKQLKQIGDWIDGYRLGIAVAISVGQEPKELPQNSTTYVSVSTLDPDGDLRVAVRLLSDNLEHGEYHQCELLAEQGISYLNNKFPNGRIDYEKLFTE